MSAEELNDKFGQWNPMEKDYKNTEFNQYITGPGADLDAELQPAQQALQNSKRNDKGENEKQPVPSLIFKHLPKDMTLKAMHNMCSRHGRVKAVRDSVKNDYYFVDMATVADMEAVIRALENNNYGFKVLVSKSKKTSDMEMNHNSKNFSPVPPKSTGIDYEKRNYRTSNKNHPRPKIQEDVLLKSSDVNNTGLPLNLLTNDAHSLERQGLYKMPNNNKFNYRNGRSYVTIPEKTRQFIDKKHNESSGIYNDSEDKYVHTMEKVPMSNQISKCSQCFYTCDTVCERCSQYYCSVQCQLNDWPDHRYKCGKPKHLQKNSPSKRESQIGNGNMKVPKENYKRTPDIKTSKDMEMKTINAIAPKEIIKYSKAVPQQISTNSTTVTEQIANSSKPNKKLPAFLKASLKQNSNSLPASPQPFSNSSNISYKKLPAALKASLKHPNPSKELTQQCLTSSNPTPQQLPNSSNTSSKKIPAALRASVKQLPKSSKESPQQLSISSKVSQSSAVSQNNSNKPLESSEDIYKQNMPRSGNVVTITAISKTNVVFIRSTTYDDHLSYLNTVDSLQLIGKMLQPMKTLPKSGDVVIAKFEEQFNRALVLSAKNPANILIHLMDYGNIEQAKMEDLLEAPKEFVYKPRHAIPVLLKDVPDFYMTQEIRKFMHSYLNNINVVIRYKPEDFHRENNVYAVELIDENTQQHFNKMIMKLSKPVEPQNTREICDRDYLEKRKLPIGKNIELIVMDNSLMCIGCISCTIKPYAIEIEKFKKEIQAYVESIPQEPYTPRVEELCIARYKEDGLWYRGQCLETVGDGHPSVLFIDYGNITIVPIESIRRYPRQFTYPIYTGDCAIEGLPESCDEELVAKLEHLVPNGELIKCENVTVDEENDFYFLYLPKVIRELTTCGLITSEEQGM